MTAIKKTTTKSTKSPAPATATAAAAKTGSKKKTASKALPAPKTLVPAASPAPAAQPVTQPPVAVVAPPAPSASTPTIKAIATKPAKTTIAARIDIGFGNALYVRGEGPGLSWDQGVAMNCLGSDRWELTLSEAARPYTFKFLVNDLSWNTGPDYTVAPGESVTLTPEF